MRRVCGLLLLLVCGGRGQTDFLAASTQDLVSVLRRNLVTNNDDFTPPRAAPAAPPRRSHYLPAPDMLDVINRITGQRHAPRGLQFPRENTPRSESKTSSMTTSTTTRPTTNKPKPNTTTSADARRMYSHQHTVTDSIPLRKSGYLLPNSLVNNAALYKSFKRNTKKSLRKLPITTASIKSTSRQPVSIFYETSINRHITVGQRSSVDLQQWFSRLRADAQKRKAHPVADLTTHHGMVIDELNLLAQYRPFTGERFEEMRTFMATKFFQFDRGDGVHGRLVPYRETPYPVTEPEPHSDVSGEPPDPQLLDIAPLKMKGHRPQRICDRNMLVPEGPKYDGRGREVMEAYTGERDFARTPRSKFIVPRCCNCCQKSVLGCE